MFPDPIKPKKIEEREVGDYKPCVNCKYYKTRKNIMAQPRYQVEIEKLCTHREHRGLIPPSVLGTGCKDFEEAEKSEYPF